jgi:hypothetical protein
MQCLCRPAYAAGRSKSQVRSGTRQCTVLRGVLRGSWPGETGFEAMHAWPGIVGLCSSRVSPSCLFLHLSLGRTRTVGWTRPTSHIAVAGGDKLCQVGSRDGHCCATGCSAAASAELSFAVWLLAAWVQLPLSTLQMCGPYTWIFNDMPGLRVTSGYGRVGCCQVHTWSHPCACMGAFMQLRLAVYMFGALPGHKTG